MACIRLCVQSARGCRGRTTVLEPRQARTEYILYKNSKQRCVCARAWVWEWPRPDHPNRSMLFSDENSYWVSRWKYTQLNENVLLIKTLLWRHFYIYMCISNLMDGNPTDIRCGLLSENYGNVMACVWEWWVSWLSIWQYIDNRRETKSEKK